LRLANFEGERKGKFFWGWGAIINGLRADRNWWRKDVNVKNDRGFVLKIRYEMMGEQKEKRKRG
jgi:hypothetical protein